MPARRLVLVLLAVVAAFALAACGSDEGGGSSEDGGAAVALDGPATLAPVNAPLYFEANITPQGDQAAALDELVANISDGKVTDARSELIKALNKSLGEENVSFERDIEPWLGGSAAIFASSLKSLSSGTTTTPSDTSAPAAATPIGLRQAQGGGGNFFTPSLPGLDSLNTNPSDFEGAVVLETKDAAKTGAFIDKVSGSGAQEKKYKDVSYKVDSSEPVAVGVVKGRYLVLGNEASFKQAVDTASGAESLAGNPAFEKAVKATPGGLAFGYLYSEGLQQSAAQSASSLRQQAQAFDMLFGQFDAIAFGVGLKDDAIKIDAAVIGAVKQPTDPGDLIEEMPADSFAAFGVGDVGEQADQFLKQLNALDQSGELERQLKSMGLDLQRDVFSWMGDAAGFVRGDSMRDLDAALVVQTTDPAKTKALINQVKPLLNLAEAAAGSSGDIKVEPLGRAEADDGFKVTTPQVPFPISIGVKGERFAIAIGDDALADAFGSAKPLGDSAAFKAAADQLADGVDPMLYANVPQVLTLVKSLAGDDAQFAKIEPYLDAFTQISAGTKSAGNATRSQIVIGVQDRD